ncbi:uncharacterized protein LOC128196130 [Vigna angularis]|uniref:uncharacterized protein LOC128196130 n=1 Tax=Phaseolus angularis TaxID=3914 RepID=UPI0022B2FB4B|nr:uncharacterized protein LOC128196130 [Vigna angularis]
MRIEDVHTFRKRQQEEVATSNGERKDEKKSIGGGDKGDESRPKDLSWESKFNQYTPLNALRERIGVFILAWERERESSRGKGALPSFRFQPTKEHRGSCTKFRRAERRIGGWVAVDGSVARWPVWRRWSKKGVVMVMEEAGRGEGASPGYGVAGAGHSAWRKPDVVAEFPLEQELEVADVAE